METNEIIAGKSIGKYYLEMPLDELKKNINGNPYEIEQRSDTAVINTGDFVFFVDDTTKKVRQITVGKKFKGKFNNKIGIGSTLQNIENEVGEYTEELDVYVLPQYKGICFELAEEGENEEWIEKQMPIEWISIFSKVE